MALFNDIRSIINPLPNKYYNDMLMNMDNILENIIINFNNNNYTQGNYYNSFIFNHVLYYTSEDSQFNKNTDIKNKIIEYVKKHISSNVRNQRIHFRE